MAQSRWKAMESRWELFQRQTEMCFKKHRVINKPNDSKFRRMADDTEEETKGCRGPRLTVCPLHLKPKHLVRCGHPLQHDSILWLQTLWMNGVQEAVPTGFGQVRSTHSQQQEQNAVMTFPKDCERQTFTPSVEETQTQNHCKPDWVSLYLVPKKLSR